MKNNKELKKYNEYTIQYKSGLSVKYRLRIPDRIEKDIKYPVIYFLHGAGGRGSDNRTQLTDAGALRAFKKNGIFSVFNSYLISAQVPAGSTWVDVAWDSPSHDMPKISETQYLSFEILKKLVANSKYQIDKNRVYVLGVSMGGFGVWDIIQRYPDYFAAAIPICGGGDTKKIKGIINLPIWSWHGDQDDVIPVDRSRAMQKSIKSSGGVSSIYSEIIGRGHNVWLDVWRSKSLWEWLFLQKRNC